jgi:hypothetical protein
MGARNPRPVGQLIFVNMCTLTIPITDTYAYLHVHQQAWCLDMMVRVFFTLRASHADGLLARQYQVVAMLGLVVPCPHLANPNFVQKVRHSIPPLASPSPHSYRRFTSQLKLVQQSPQLTQSLLSTDPRLIDVIGALMGLDVQGFGRPEGSDDLPPGVSPTFATPPTSPPPSSAKPTSPPKATPGTVSSSNINKSEDVEMAEAEEEQVDEEEAAAKKAADAEKKLGADAYKKPDLAPAIEHFSNAWETWPKDITFLSNLAGRSYRTCLVHAPCSSRVYLSVLLSLSGIL